MKTPLFNAPHNDKYNKLFSSLHDFWMRKRLDVLHTIIEKISIIIIFEQN